jgi:hypothetical protein
VKTSKILAAPASAATDAGDELSAIKIQALCPGEDFAFSLSILLIGSRQTDRVRSAIKDLVDKFINAWLEVNPPKR